MAGDTIGIWDSGNQRLTLITADGAIAHETRLEAIPAWERLAEPVGFVDGGIIAVTARQPPAVREIREPLAFWRHSRNGAPQQQLIESAGVQNFAFEWFPGSAPTLDHLPFGPWPGYTVDDGGMYVSTGEAREIRRVSASGEIEALWRHRRPLPELTDSVVNEFEESVMQGAPADPEGRAAWQRWFEKVPYPERAAVYGCLLMGQDGVLWAADMTAPTFDPRRWWLFDPTGQLLGDIKMPERFHPLDAGEDWVLGKRTNELDVEYVQLFEILGRNKLKGQ